VEEIIRETASPPVDSPERRATFERSRAAEFLVRQVLTADDPKRR
jgi:hypothetical protein